MTRQMVMVGFLQAQNCTNLPFSWRHPDSRSDFATADYYQEIARVLERGKFHMAFFDDRLAMPDRYGGDHVHAIENGIRCVKLDPIVTLMTMGMATTRLGLGATCSTTYYEPFHVARMFGTLDHMTGGRAAWNVVTSLNDGEAMNMGRTEVIPHDERYDRADEFMQVVLGHWDSWEDDAVIVDKQAGRFGDGAKVHRLDHVGEYYRSRGPFTVPRTPQGRPVLIQAGMSGRGTQFAARWGEVIFAPEGATIKSSQDHYARLKGETERLGRDPDSQYLCMAMLPITAATKAEAEDKMALAEKLPKEIDQLSLLSEALNYDFAARDMDAPMTDEELEGLTGLLSIRDQVVRDTGITNPSTRDLINHSPRGTVRNAVVGGPKEVADALEEQFEARACDGFVVAASHIPGGYADFVEHVIPELQRRGLYHADYAGATLRDNLGLPRADRGDLLSA